MNIYYRILPEMDYFKCLERICRTCVKEVKEIKTLSYNDTIRKIQFKAKMFMYISD